MGRKKPAPQPLTLQASATSPTTAIRSGDSSAMAPDNLPSASSLSVADSSKSPASATVPRSSPFTSKFSSQAKRPQTARLVTDSSSRSLTSDYHSQQQQQSTQEQMQSSSSPSQQPSQLDTTASSSTSHYEPVAAAPPAPSQQPAQQPEPARPRTGRFHFSKPSKSSNHFSNHSHKHSEPLVPSRAQTQGNLQHLDATPSKSSKPLKLRSSRSELSLLSVGDRDSTTLATSSRKNKPKSFGLLTRNKSVRDKEISSPTELRDPLPAFASQTSLQPQPQQQQPPQITEASSPALKTAPVANDRSFRDMMESSAQRNRSEDRAPASATQARGGEGAQSSSREANSNATANSNANSNANNSHSQSQNHSTSQSHSHSSRDHRAPNIPPATRENGSFLSGLRSSSTKAAGMIGSRFFGRGLRSAHASEREAPLDDEHYEIKVLNLPLAEQTRKTRISKRLEDSRDKTEFWMPSFPWRAIDYLNYKGCEIEGLYRVPGSGPQIKRWQRKFDEELDVDLFEQDDLYDINIIGSMLKAWLRELPDELFPKAAQERISRECAGAETVPQMLIDELSDLSPFQYYLLFAITCHLSLLLAHSDKNKMDFRNLCICFQPCMKIDVFCFKFLVCDWRDCWKGCRNEGAYIEEEYQLLDVPPPRGIGLGGSGGGQSPAFGGSSTGSPRTPSPNDDDDRDGASSSVSGSVNGSIRGGGSRGGHKKKASKSSRGQTETPKVAKGDLRRLSPIEPLSPLGF